MMNTQLEEIIEKVSKAYKVNSIEKIKCDIISDKCELYEITKGDTKENSLYIEKLNIHGIRDIITFSSEMSDTKPVFKTKFEFFNIRKKKNGENLFSEYFPKNSKIKEKNNKNLNLFFELTLDFLNNNKNKNNIYFSYFVELEKELELKGEAKFEIKQSLNEIKKEIDLNKLYFIIATIEAIGKDNYIPDMKYYLYTVDLERVGATPERVNKVYFDIDSNKKFNREEFENENRIYFNSKEFESSEAKTIIKNITKEKVLSFLLDENSDTTLIIKNNTKKNMKEILNDYEKNPLSILSNFVFLVK